MSPAFADRRRHGRGDFPPQGVGGEDAHGPADDVGVPGVDHHGVFPGGGGVGPGLQHGGGGGGVGPHGDDFRGKPRGLALAHQGSAHAPALAVDDEKFFLFHSRLLSI